MVKYIVDNNVKYIPVNPNFYYNSGLFFVPHDKKSSNVRFHYTMINHNNKIYNYIPHYIPIKTKTELSKFNNIKYIVPQYVKKKKRVYCINCGKQGHIFKSCREPVTSCGIICYKLEGKQLKYLMIQRKDSLAYVEFVRGKYTLNNINYLIKLFKTMTPNERERILTMDFHEIWVNLWCKQNTKKYEQEYQRSLERFDLLKKGINVYDPISCSNRIVNLEYIYDNTITEYNDTEWGFPKGRRQIRENDLDCAVREFSEETGYRTDDIELLDESNTYNEVFKGSNGIRYKHIYYLAQLCDNQKDVKFDPTNKNQVIEIKDVRWFTYYDVLDNIRECNQERKHIFKNTHFFLKKNFIDCYT